MLQLQVQRETATVRVKRCVVVANLRLQRNLEKPVLRLNVIKQEAVQVKAGIADVDLVWDHLEHFVDKLCNLLVEAILSVDEGLQAVPDDRCKGVCSSLDDLAEVAHPGKVGKG